MSTNSLTVTKRELAEEVAAACGVPLACGTQAVETVCEAIRASLDAGRRVELRGLMSLHTVTTRERPGRNPRTGAVAIVPARRKVRGRFHLVLTL